MAEGSSRVRGAGGYLPVAAATGLVNLAGYALTVAAARRLGPEEFGAFGALLALVLVGNVAALAAQATVARRAARARTLPPAVHAGLVLGAVAATTLALCAPVLASYLRLAVPAGPLAVAVAVAALAAAAVPIGTAQGRERFRTLALLVSAQGVLRVGGGLAALALEPSAAAVLTGTAVGLALAAGLAWVVVRPPRPRPRGSRPLLRDATAAGVVLLGFVTLTNVDVALARHVLSGTESGWYAAGSIFTKVAFWLPQFVPLVAFPAFADPARRHAVLRRTLLAVSACGAGLVLVSAAASELLVDLVAGPAYAPLAAWLPWFTALGALFAVAQLLVYAQLAAGDHRTGVLVWLVLAVLVLTVELTAGSVPGVLVPALVAASAVLVWGLLRERASAASGATG